MQLIYLLSYIKDEFKIEQRMTDQEGTTQMR